MPNESLREAMALHPTPALDPVLADLADRGYETTRLDGADLPTAVARGGSAPDAVTDRPLSVEPLARATPLELVARLADAARNRRATAFVAAPETAERAVETLDDPFLRPGGSADGVGDGDAGESGERGGRRFYSIPDRIHLCDGTLAAVGAAGGLSWREDATARGVTGDGDAPALVLRAGGDPVVALPSVDALTCPGPEPDAFPFRYAREDDRRLHVSSRDREVGTFTSITAMRDRGFRPAPLPLVPEHHLLANAHLARRWIVAVVEGGGVRYVTP